MNQVSNFRAFKTVVAMSWRASLRERVFSVVGVLASLLLGASFFFQSFEFGTDPQGFLADFSFGLILIFGSILAVMLPGYRWFAEMDGKLCLPVLSRAVNRGTYFVGQWFGLAGVLAVFVVAMNSVLAVILLWQSDGAQGVASLFLGLFEASLLQVARLWIIASFVFFLGSFARGNLFVVTLAFVFVFSGQIMPTAAAYEGVPSGMPVIVWQSVLLLVPNLGAFGLDGADVLAGDGFGNSGSLLGYSLLYVTAYLSLGAWTFSKRELA
jgi:hypothetical protein